MTDTFRNNDSKLKAEVRRVMDSRAASGLEGMIGGLEAIVINVQPERQKSAVQQLLETTGHGYRTAFERGGVRTCVLGLEGSADILVTARQEGDNPFRPFNTGPKGDALPDTRLETLVFKCPELEKVVEIQKGRGVRFMTDQPVRTDAWLFIQTEPSPYTGNSVGYIQWLGDEGQYVCEGASGLSWTFDKPDWPHLADIRELDHAATRVRAEERDKAIIEFMELTNYHFDFAIYVEALNSITNVARLTHDDYAMVFTSGIEPFRSVEESGPTELFIHNYNTRVHHLAFRTENIVETFEALGRHGMKFLVELVGSPEEGLRQTFTEGFEDTFIVNEYIHRYGGFDGFFTKSNVTMLTKATERQ
ncbi:hypothetical protein [Salidesulfovibrio brasiliensis]|uniref:hypothetical protein n=1 Tax=Salidesulfovibrio brasiliensis TaxID=221711 RepID=UPI0006D221A7|nr:hypothetical protein [Salidesulfovibrio brasiliensis]